jgi:hypothetical protein
MMAGQYRQRLGDVILEAEYFVWRGALQGLEPDGPKSLKPIHRVT